MNWLVPLVALSFVPFLWKAVEYALIGSHLPAAAFVVLASLTAAGIAAGGVWRRRAVRTWCAAMILWGAARLGLEALIIAADLNEAHLLAQLSVMFNVVSVAYILAGIALWRWARPRYHAA